MIVTGGVYYERCLSPSSIELFGSGGRAAAALSGLTDVTLHTFFPQRFEQDAIANFTPFGIETHAHASTDVVEFHYHFPLSPPRFAPIPLPTAAPACVSGQNITRFGCVEGEMIVEADMAVYDPQSGSCPRPFSQNGSSTRRLAVVLNQSELCRLSGDGEIADQVSRLIDAPEVAVVKCGPHGAFVFENNKLLGHIPIYRAQPIFKIGSGDIFTAMFAFHWCEGSLSPLESANEASKYVAHYVQTRSKQMPKSLSPMEAWTPKHEPARIYLAGSFFSAEHLWLIEESYAALLSFGLPVFSPFHEIGVGTGTEIAQADLVGLDNCSIVLALLSDRDPGTVFEIGHAIAQGKRVIAFMENAGPQDLTMILGTGCEVYNDLTTAIYHAAWASME